MKKIFTIAAREYRAMVGTKAFLISIIMMPVLMLGSLLAIELLRNAGQVKERKIAVIDHSGKFTAILKAKADEKNRKVDEAEKARKAPNAESKISENDFLGIHSSNCQTGCAIRTCMRFW
jgi:ABC-type Na+ efflux pump permease subunit